jgi:RHS repeat-associated protein
LSQLDKVGSKELQDEFGLAWYDYGARNYDTAVARFMNLDPLTEKYHTQSPFVYADNNPVMFRDINGMGVEDDYVFNEKGEYKYKIVNDKPDQIVIKNSTTNIEEGRYDFNDPVNDVNDINSGKITRVVFIKQSDIEQ